MTGTCKTCRYFKPSQGGPFLKMLTLGSGECVRNPPKPWSVFHMAQRPIVYPNQSCGQWESKYGDGPKLNFGELKSIIKTREPEAIIKTREPEAIIKTREPEAIIKTREPEAINKTYDTEPLRILKTRYAKGEITKKEFEQIKKDILELDEEEPIEKTIKPKKETKKPIEKKTPQSIVNVEELKENSEVNRLIDKIHQGNYKERIDSIKTLGALGDKKAVEPLLEIINEKPKDESTVPLILKALVEIGDSNAIERLTEIKKNTSKYLDKQFSEVIQSLSSVEKPKMPKKEIKKPKKEKIYKISCPQCNSKIEVGESVKKLKCPECGYKLEFT